MAKNNKFFLVFALVVIFLVFMIVLNGAFVKPVESFVQLVRQEKNPSRIELLDQVEEREKQILVQDKSKNTMLSL